MYNKIKLLYITTIPLTQWFLLRGQNQYLAKRGFELHSITSRAQYFEELAERDGMIMHCVNIQRTIVPYLDAFSIIKMYFLIRQIKPHIVHYSTPKAAFLGAIASWLARAPIRVFLVRGLHFEKTFGLKRRFFRLLEKLTVMFSSQCIFTSGSLLEFALAQGITAETKGIILAHGMSNGIDIQRFNRRDVNIKHHIGQLRESIAIPPTAKVIGFVGRLSNDKGISDLAKAWRNIRTIFLDTHLLLVGPWCEEIDPVPAEVKSQLLSDNRVHFTGYVRDTQPYYAIMTIKVYPSHGTEGFPNAPMEAAAMELPVVATAVVGSVDAVVDGVTGMLVEPRNPDALALAIGKYLSDPELCKQHGQAGRERVTRYFRQEIVWEALYNKYCELLNINGLGKNDTGLSA